MFIELAKTLRDFCRAGRILGLFTDLWSKTTTWDKMLQNSVLNL